MPTILVADDDPIVRLFVSAVLRKAGFQVVQASDGAEALGRIRAGEEFALVVTDVQMPRLDGDDLLREIRGDAAARSLPVIVMTATDGGNAGELPDRDATGYIRKPIAPAELLGCVRRLLGDGDGAG